MAGDDQSTGLGWACRRDEVRLGDSVRLPALHAGAKVERVEPVGEQLDGREIAFGAGRVAGDQAASEICERVDHFAFRSRGCRPALPPGG